jgi:DNA-binding LacI/PurR family transcriptional regulator
MNYILFHSFYISKLANLLHFRHNGSNMFEGRERALANISDVAAEAGVSVATVSRVLNAPEKVLPSTQKRVRDAIVKLNYNPNDNRRTCIYNNTRTLLVVMNDFSNMFLIDVLSGINSAAFQHSYSLLLCATNSSLERERETVKLLNNRQADGVIFLSSCLEDSDHENIAASFPMIQCCEYSETSKLPHISIDNYTAFCEAMEFLIKLGYHEIALLSSTNGLVSTVLRESAYRNVLQRHGITVPLRWLLRGSDSFSGGYETMQGLLKQSMRPRAVLCNSDNAAAGAIRAIREAGLRIPKDIAIMGTDNLELCNMVTPTLTTTAQPRKRLGQVAVKMLLQQIMGETDQQSIFLPHELIVRNST